jgi:hypothetical protein
MMPLSVQERVDAGCVRFEAAWKAHIESVTEGYYEESNQRTSELIGIDLGSHGYRMGLR